MNLGHRTPLIVLFLQLHLFPPPRSQFCPLYCEQVELDLHSPGCYELRCLQYCESLHACIATNHHQMAIAATASQGSGWEHVLVCHPQVNLSGHGRGGFLISLPVWSPRLKDRYSHYLETGRADTRSGPGAGGPAPPAPVNFLAPVPHLTAQALGRARTCQLLATRSYLEHLMQRAACSP